MAGNVSEFNSDLQKKLCESLKNIFSYESLD